MPKPEDTRCRAKVGNGRCTNEIMLDTETGDWQKLCENHAAQENQARAEGGARVVMVEAGEESEDSDE